MNELLQGQVVRSEEDPLEFGSEAQSMTHPVVSFCHNQRLVQGHTVDEEAVPFVWPKAEQFMEHASLVVFQ